MQTSVKSQTLRTLVFASAIFVIGLFTAPAMAGEKPIYTGFLNNLAVSGHDTVAYFREGRPVEGSSAFEHKWKGATWRFVNAKNLADFKADPAAFAPQYGGYCAWAVAEGYTASAVPEAWRIVDGKLYLNYSKSIQATWQEDIPANIKRADGNWPKVIK